MRGRAERLSADCGAIQVLAETRLEAVAGRDRGARAAGVRDRLGADAALRGRRGRARRAQPGAPGHDRADARRQGARRHDPAGRPGHQGRRRSPARARSSTSSTACSRSRATTCAPTASCAPPRTASARPTRPASSRWAPPGSSRSTTRPRLYLAEAGARVGSCVFPAIEGSRALLVEVQALVGRTEIVPPRRVAVGVDRTRLAQIIAVLSRHAGLRLGDHDVFVSVAGGARALDPAADLAIALAVTSAHRGVPAARRDGGLRRAGPDGRGAPGRPRGAAPRRGRRPRDRDGDHAARAPGRGPGLARATCPSCGSGGPGGPRGRLRPLTGLSCP